MRLSKRTGDGKKKWRERALLVDPHKTRITLEPTVKTKRVPPWIYRKTEDTHKFQD